MGQNPELVHMNQRIIPRFMVFEGLDGSGTTTQTSLLEKRLRAASIPVYSTCEPTERFTGRAIRKALGGEEKITHGTMAKLFAADRHEHLYDPDQGIIKHTSEGFTVICDRYLFSSLAYQSPGYGFKRVFRLNYEFPLPEHLFFLDISPETGDERMSIRDSREIYEQIILQKQVREYYHRTLDLYSGTKMKIYIFDGTLPIEILAENIWRALGG